MKITAIKLENWLAHRFFEIPVIAPLAIIAGPNARGKSAVRDAIAFALTSALCRVDLKGERDQLITDGAKKGSVSLWFGGETCITRDVETAKLTKANNFSAGGNIEGLATVLDPPWLARLSVEDRSGYLSAILGTGLTGTTAREELKKRGRQADLIDAWKGDDIKTWAETAGKQATEARGAWKSITGENYGSTKAKDWAAAGPAIPTDDEEAEALRCVTERTKDVEVLQRAMGAIEAIEKGLPPKQDSMRRIALEQQAAQFDKAAGAATDIATEIAMLENEQVKIRAELADLVPEGVTGCPWCRNAVRVDQDGAIVKADVASEIAIDPKARGLHGRLEEIAEGVAAQKSALAAAEHTKQVAQNARTALAQIEAQDEAAAPPEAASVKLRRADTEEALREATENLRKAESDLTKLRRRREDALNALDRTKRARDAYNRVLAWTEIAADLAPDGIPQQRLVNALVGFNRSLSDLAGMFSWPVPQINDAVQVTVQGRRYGLCSESEQWRADALLALAIAMQTKLRFVVLDRFDVLEPAARGPAMSAFYKLTSAHAMEQCILVGTFKEAPRAPKGVTVVWLGETPEQARAAA